MRAICLFASLVAGVTLAADQAPQIRTLTELVRVDVSVLDRNRAPVEGLTKDDFVVRENGKVVPVETLVAITLPEATKDSAPWMMTAPFDTRSNDLGLRERLVVIVLDDALTPGFPQFVQGAKTAARTVVEQMGAQDAAAVVFTQNNRHAQGFTTDRARLLTAIETFTGGMHNPSELLSLTGGRAERVRAVGTIQTLDHLARVLGAVPDRRKTIAFISSGIPVHMDGSSTDEDQLHTTFRSMVRHAREGNVNIHAIDPGGVGGIRDQLERGVIGQMDQTWQATEMARRRMGDVEFTYRFSLRLITESTGGRSFAASNEFESQAPAIFREAGTYYLVGYRSPDTTADGKFRRIEVRTTRPGLTVNVRSGYYAPEPKPVAPVAVSTATLQALANLLPKPDLPLSVTAIPIAQTATGDPTLGIVLHMPPPADSATNTFNVIVQAYTVNGDLVQSQTFRATSSGRTSYDLLTELRVPPGRYDLRTGAVEMDTNTSGSVFLNVDVPDFRSAAFSLSGAALAVEPSGPVASPEHLADLLPLIPTTRRTFRASESVRAFARVYQAGVDYTSPVQTTTRITDAHGVVVFDRPRTIGSDQFNREGAFDLLTDVPIADLAPGPYVLTITGVVGRETLERHVRFVIE